MIHVTLYLITGTTLACVTEEAEAAIILDEHETRVGTFLWPRFGTTPIVGLFPATAEAQIHWWNVVAVVTRPADASEIRLATPPETEDEDE